MRCNVVSDWDRLFNTNYMPHSWCLYISAEILIIVYSYIFLKLFAITHFELHIGYIVPIMDVRLGISEG